MFNLSRRSSTVLPCLLVVAVLGCGQTPPESKKREVKKAPRPIAKPLVQTNKESANSAELPDAKSKPPVGPMADPVLVAQVPAFQPEPLDPMRFTLPEVDELKRTERGIRKLESKHLTLYTDVPSSTEVDELPKVFDLAVPRWTEYFGVEPARAEKWRMVGMLVKDKERFFDTGLWPDDLPPFLHGYMIDNRFWLYEQPSDYYRRELLLHEGTHGFMWAFLGGMGPPWYGEGTAELLGTHAWDQRELTLGVVPPSKEASPMWGRVKAIKDGFAANKALPLLAVVNIERRAFLESEAYAWCWGAAVFFDHDPKYQKAFRMAQAEVDDLSPQFFKRMIKRIPEPHEQIAEQWQCFVANVEYGYDVARESILRKESMPLPDSGANFGVLADRGWQSAGLTLQASKTYELQASGRFQIGESTKPWISEAQGITLKYHKGRPIGMLLAAVTDEGRSGGVSPLLDPVAIGPSGKITPEKDGILFLRVNDSPAELFDNAGELSVVVRAVE